MTGITFSIWGLREMWGKGYKEGDRGKDIRKGMEERI